MCAQVDSALAENEAKWEKALLTLERLDTIKVSAAAGEVSRSLGDKVEDMAEKAKNAGTEPGDIVKQEGFWYKRVWYARGKKKMQA